MDDIISPTTLKVTSSHHNKPARKKCFKRHSDKMKARSVALPGKPGSEGMSPAHSHKVLDKSMRIRDTAIYTNLKEGNRMAA